MDDSGYARYQRFFHADPQEVVSWKDPESEAEGWLAINSLTGGAAGGGTRMKADAKRDDAVFLAKTMEIKFRVSGPKIGGAKSVLRFDPSDPRKPEVLRRWFLHIADHLRNHYGTGGDQNVNEDEVCQLTSEAIGLDHPQEGIVRGHVTADEAERRRIVEQLKKGVLLSIREAGEPTNIAEMITGYGVAESLAAYFEHRGESLAGKRILVEGFGDVGGSAAYYLHQAGARVVGAICVPRREVFRWQADDRGLDVPTLLTHREGKERSNLPAGGVEAGSSAPFWSTPADVFVPAATSYTIDAARLERLAEAGVRVIACGANTPFADFELGACDVQKAADQRFAVIPDFIANCGMARTFAYLMQDGVAIHEAAIKEDVSRAVRDAMHRLLDGHPRETGLLERAFSQFVPS